MLYISSSRSWGNFCSAVRFAVQGAARDMRSSLMFQYKRSKLTATRIKKRVGRMTRMTGDTSSVFWRKDMDQKPIIRAGEIEFFSCNFLVF